jgi:protein-S-isoprenylcysteine O-methyltransferase Ste14
LPSTADAIEQQDNQEVLMARLLGLIYGLGAYLFFGATFLYAIGFAANVPGLKTIDSGAAGDRVTAAVIDVVLLGLFAIQHSVMARRGFKQWWTRIVPAVVERSTYVLAASLILALVIWQWRPMTNVVWSVDSPVGQTILHALFALGWLILLVATFLISHFELFGLQQVYSGWRGRQTVPPSFKTPGLYKVVRHPIYLGFILGFWATPHMTEGHLLFAAASTAYIFIGIFFEERDLIASFGDDYRRYRRRVPMVLPFLTLGRAGKAVPRPEQRGS